MSNFAIFIIVFCSAGLLIYKGCSYDAILRKCEKECKTDLVIECNIDSVVCVKRDAYTIKLQ